MTLFGDERLELRDLDAEVAFLVVELCCCAVDEVPGSGFSRSRKRLKMDAMRRKVTSPSEGRYFGYGSESEDSEKQ